MAHAVVALPGLHGTVGLFASVLRERPDNVEVIPIGYPTDKPMTYEQLRDFVSEKLPRERQWSLIAESFSGPLALQLARVANPRVVVLCASFARSPVPKSITWLPLTALFSVPPPVWLLSRILTGGDEKLARALQRELRLVSPRVLAERIREIVAVDVSDEIKECRCPIVYIRAKNDRLIPPKTAAEIQKLNGGTVVVDVEAPHLILQTASAKVWASIKGYFS